jgi:hypothetical protein
MNHRQLILALVLAVSASVAFTQAARADDRDRHDRDRHEREWRAHEVHDHYYGAPPVVYGAPPAVVYAPPPVVVGVPSGGINVVVPLHIR